MSDRNDIYVPYGKSVHDQREIDAVVHVLKTSTQMGEHVRQFEARVARLFAKSYGVMVNSGSSANYLAIEILDLPKGSEVITPALTFSTTVAPLVKNGLVPVFVDVEPTTYNIDIAKIESMITEKTKAILVPNLLGNVVNWQALQVIAKRYNLITIEDSADTLGATLHGHSVGQYTDISTTSFYGSHVINCAGNGGMLCVNSERFASRAKLLRSWGRSSSLYVDSEAIENRFNLALDDIQYDAKFVFEAIGYNFEPSEMGAAYGLVQLDKLADNITARETHFQRHLNFFSHYDSLFLLPQQTPGIKTGWLAFPLIVKETAGFTRTDLQIFLEQHHIQTRTVFTGNILRQPGFKQIVHRAHPEGFSNTDRVMRGGLLIACHHGLTEEMISHTHTTLTRFFDEIAARAHA